MAITTVRYSSISNPQRFQSLAQATYVAPTPSTVGMVLMNPTSIDYSGTSATLGANGQVTFSAVTSLSLNGCFTADFDNYVVSIRHNATTSFVTLLGRLRASGTDATGSDYTHQYLLATSTSVSADRFTSTSRAIGVSDDEQRSGTTAFIYGPALAQPTAWRQITVNGDSGAVFIDHAATHSVSSSYDGLTIYVTSGTYSGALQVYGVRS